MIYRSSSVKVNHSQQMVLLFVLIDSRHDLMKIDRDFLISLGERGVPFAILLTKCDKLGTNALASRIATLKKELGEWWEPLPEILATSSETGLGREALLDYIGKVNDDLDKTDIQ